LTAIGRKPTLHTPMKLIYGVAGRITNSPKSSHRVRVEDDAANTGGFLVYEWWNGTNGPNAHHAFDSWVESMDDLTQFIEASGWIIQWPDAGVGAGTPASSVHEERNQDDDGKRNTEQQQ
jgi:hypothetical protein